jgi:hypothetical protein
MYHLQTTASMDAAAKKSIAEDEAGVFAVLVACNTNTSLVCS